MINKIKIGLIAPFNYGTKLKSSYELLTDNHKVDLGNSITLLGIEIDNKLNFEKHVTALCQNAGRSLNALSRMHK